MPLPVTSASSCSTEAHGARTATPNSARFSEHLRAWPRSEPKSSRLSVDDEATTAELVAKHGLTFPVGHSADAKAIAASTGAFVDPERGYLQSTGFVLNPEGRVVISVYSSGAIGRLVPEDVVGLIRYLRAHASAST